MPFSELFFSRPFPAARSVIGTFFVFANIANVAHAQDWPMKPVRVIVPHAPGGVTDMLARLVADRLTAALKQSFVVENRAGAGGIVGSDQVSRAAADGYTLVASGMASHVIAPNAGAAPFDPMKSFTHIAMLGGPPLALLVHPSVQVKTVKEFVALTRTRSGGVSYGSPGAGTHNHLMGELFRGRTGADMTHVSYKGGGPAAIDLIGGHIPSAFLTLSTAAPHIKSGRVRALAITSAGRLPEYAQVPTFAETGYADLTTTNWSGYSGPAGMPANVVARLNTEVVRSLRAADLQERLQAEGIRPNEMSSSAFTDFFHKEIERWTPVAKAAGLRIGG